MKRFALAFLVLMVACDNQSLLPVVEGDEPTLPMCGDGVLDAYEQCDYGIPEGEPGACPDNTCNPNPPNPCLIGRMTCSIEEPCEYVLVPNGTACGPHSTCNDGYCSADICQNKGGSDNGCHVWRWDASGSFCGPVEPVADGTPCNDDMSNTANDRCVGGECVGECTDLECECQGAVVTYYRDRDGDRFGDNSYWVQTCAGQRPMDPEVGTWVETPGDCNDLNSDVNPSEVEQCDEQDDDCDGTIDEEPCGTAAPCPSCDDGNECTSDVCLTTGECTHDPVIDGAGCFDGNGCHASQCIRGDCTTIESIPGCLPCNTEGEDCSNIVRCSLGSLGFSPSLTRGAGACHDHRCEVVVEECDDGDPCTVDTCDAPSPPLWRLESGCGHTVVSAAPICLSCTADSDCGSIGADARCHPAFGCVRPSDGYYPIQVALQSGTIATSVSYVGPAGVLGTVPLPDDHGRVLRSPAGTEAVLIDYPGRAGESSTRWAPGTCQFSDGSRQPIHWLDETRYGENAWGCSVSDPLRW